MRLRPKTLALLITTLAAPGGGSAWASAGIPVERGFAEHTVTTFTVDRRGVLERHERQETWVSATRAKVVYRDPATNEVIGACAGTRRVLRCFRRDPATEVSTVAPGQLFVPSWAEAGRTTRRWLARGWMTETAQVDHRGIAGRRLEATPSATGDPGDTFVIAERETLSILYRQTRTEGPDGRAVTSTADVLVRERVRARGVDFRLHAPRGARIRSLELRRAAP